MNLEVDVMAKYAERLLERTHRADARPKVRDDARPRRPRRPGVASRREPDRSTPTRSRRIPEAVAAIVRGEIIVVVDDEDRENEGDLIMAAEAATPEKIAFFVRHTSGVICAPLTGERLDELDIPLMVRDGTPRRSARRSPTRVDYRHGTTTGISAADRAATIQALIDPGDAARRPGPSRSHLPAALLRGRRRSSGPATPRPRSTWPAWPASTRPACCARSSTTTARWPASPTWSSSATSTTC